jgi:exopolyphosphatase/pppGpp-phosphohydrolase
MIEYYIDIGSSTIKVYKYEKTLKMIDEFSIYFKDGFAEKKGLSYKKKMELYNYFRKLKENHQFKYENTYLFATGIFRLISKPEKNKMVKYFHEELNLHFNVISHGLENYYLGQALYNNYKNKKIMIINMGGKTTEIITFKDNVIIKRMNINVGVTELLNTFPGINDNYASVKIDDITSFVTKRLKGLDFDSNYDGAILTGGEERFEKLTRYHLVENKIFNDGIHKYMVGYDDFVKGNENIFYNISLDELYGLMPGNPKWMDGARAGAVLPQAIFEKTKIKFIIPSDLNLINGIINDIKR